MNGVLRIRVRAAERTLQILTNACDEHTQGVSRNDVTVAGHVLLSTIVARESHHLSSCLARLSSFLRRLFSMQPSNCSRQMIAT
jgi:hypothetical protein